MKDFCKKFAVPIISGVIGGAFVLIGLRLSPTMASRLIGENINESKHNDSYNDILEKQVEIQKKFDELFEGDFLKNGKPFEALEEMRENMERRVEEFDLNKRGFKNPFDIWFSEKFGGGSLSDFSQKEDDKYIYFEILVENLDETTISTSVEDGYLTIIGNFEEKDKGSIIQSITKSTFKRSFPLPPNVDIDKMEILNEKNKIVIKFPKLKV